MTIIHSDINVKTLSLGHGGKFEKKKKLFIFSAPKDLPQNLLEYFTRVFNHPV
jgi:hypothetical protein